MAKRLKGEAAKKSAAPFPIQAGTGEHGLAYCLIKNQEAKTPWVGDDATYAKMRWGTVDAIIDCRAHGMRERDVIAHARRYVRDWFSSGLMPNPVGNAAVRMLAHLNAPYPLNGKCWFIDMLTGQGFTRDDAAAMIAAAVRDCIIHTRRVGSGIDYRLTYEPRTRAVCDLAERVAGLMDEQPGGIPFKHLRHVACRIVGRGIECGAALIERALNAGVVRAEIRGDERRRERFIFPNFKTKGLICCPQTKDC